MIRRGLATTPVSRWPTWSPLTLCVVLAVSGCSVNKPFQGDGYTRPADADRLLLMPIDIEMGEISAAGMYEPKVEWTEQSLANVTHALNAELGARSVEVIPYRSPEGPIELEPDHTQAVKLFEAVRQTIFEFKYAPASAMAASPRLATKKDKFDWTLGESVTPLRQDYDADYALFVVMQDTQPTAGRTAMNLLMAYMFLSIDTSDNQFGFAALVDLHSGDLIWTNLIASQLGDLRDPTTATESVSRLVQDIPL